MKNLKILGTGCAKCEKLARNAEEAVRNLGMECEIEKVTDITDIMRYGVMVTPALVVDGAVKAAGKVPTPPEIERFLRE
jgi:small redox-active disulfide protein 2